MNSRIKRKRNSAVRIIGNQIYYKKELKKYLKVRVGLQIEPMIDLNPQIRWQWRNIKRALNKCV